MIWVGVVIGAAVVIAAVIVTAFILLRMVSQSGLVAEHSYELPDEDSAWLED